jgi:hypothetical protein
MEESGLAAIFRPRDHTETTPQGAARKPSPAGRYQPGERGWIKIKNRDYWRYELEREAAVAKRRQRMFV